jgi:hypothetical protein
LKNEPVWLVDEQVVKINERLVQLTGDRIFYVTRVSSPALSRDR